MLRNALSLATETTQVSHNLEELPTTAHLIVRDAASLATAMSDYSEGTTFGGFSEYTELGCQGMAFPYIGRQ